MSINQYRNKTTAMTGEYQKTRVTSYVTRQLDMMRRRNILKWSIKVTNHFLSLLHQSSNTTW